MATPQLENGYTKIANEILDHLIHPGISGSEYRILIFVLRKTYGYGKKLDCIPLSQFEKATQMNRPQVVRTIKELVSKRILAKQINLYGINKNWEKWIVSKRIHSIQLDNSGGIQKDTLKRKYNYRVLPKESKQATIPFEDFWKIYPKKKARRDAEKVWGKIPIALQEAVMADIPRRMKTEEWKKLDGQYIPYPATYLRGERWTDQLDEISASPIKHEALILRP